ncbi:MAG TPA: PAS domain S-box protein [Bryobacteraceae bacterium]|nr:PAS domain S-box protein [Bryobacteraceae bacterium]
MEKRRKRQTGPAQPSSRDADNLAADARTSPDSRSASANGLPSDITAAEIVSSLPDGLIVVDARWRIVYASAEATRIYRKSPGHLVGRGHWEAWPESIGTGVERELRRAMQDRVIVCIEHRCDAEGARGMWAEIRAFPCGPGIAICCRDISSRRRVETELRQREKELADFVENAAIGLHWVAEDGTILRANDAELNMLGYTRDEYIGHNVREFHADAAVITDILERLKRREEITRCEARLRARDGSIRYVAMTFNVYSENGQFIHTRCFTRDITEQKRATELQERLAAIVESSDDAIISKDLNGIIRSWNSGAERIFGYTAEEIIGKPVATLAVPERMDEMPNILDRIRRGERVDHYETRRRTKDGRVLAISLTVSPIRDASGEIIGASKIARDITERGRTVQALRESNAALTRANADLEQFAYSASHDLQEPLRMIAAYTAMLKRKFGGSLDDTSDEYFRYIVEGVQRMQQLIHDLLAYTQASTFFEQPESDADANEALRHAISNLQQSIAGSGASITHTRLPTVRMHQFQLQQVFQNLISNAIKYRGEEAPQVHVGAERKDGRWLFSVRDNGIGIDPKYKERIFGMFKRLHSIAEYPGTGIGLAICQRIINGAGGHIWVESELGRGSIFFFTAPPGRND